MVNSLLNGRNIAIIGLGYVGLPLALAFSQKLEVIAYDINKERIDFCKKNHSCKNIKFTSEESDIKNAICYIIAVPTPVNKDHSPDISILKAAIKTVGQYLKKDDYVIYESTVYPGLTEDICIPILEKYSNLTIENFKVGYSPERINPGDKINTITNIQKVVSGIDDKSATEIENLYSLIINSGVHKAKSIKIAEAAKIIENTQRDINIAFINEVAILLDKMNIPIREVLKAASTKWNFLNFKPGLVGGHCIGIDPYYLIDKAKDYNFSPKLIEISRNINENMALYIANKTRDILNQQGRNIEGCKILILGYCFKEDVDDVRNSKVESLAKHFLADGMSVKIVEPLVDKKLLHNSFNLDFIDYSECKNFDVVVLAVAHEEFKKITLEDIKAKNKDCILIDIKEFFDPQKAYELGLTYWGL